MKIIQLARLEDPAANLLKLPEQVFKRTPRKMDVDRATQEVMDKLNYYDTARETSQRINADPANDPAETKRGQLEQDAPTSPVAAEALRILNSLTPQQEAEWIGAFFPEYNVLKQDELLKLINLPTPREQEYCMDNIIQTLGEKPEFASLVQLSPEELAEVEATPIEDELTEDEPTAGEASDVIGAGVTQVPTPVATPVAKTLKVTLTKEAWLKIAKEKNWL